MKIRSFEKMKIRVMKKSMFFLFGLLVTGIMGFSQFWGAKEASPFETLPQQLKQGQFTWKPELAPEGPILVVVSLDEQIAYTYRNGIMIGACKVSTGKPGHETPTGVFHTKYKDANHHSSKYNNAAMPYTQMMTNTGIALHAGGLPGYPSSHGCVHLPSVFAKLLFAVSPKGMTVVLANKKTAPKMVDHPSFVSPVNPDGSAAQVTDLAPNESYRWNPDTSLRGPLSIIISRYDKEAIVMRDGEEQGRAKIAIAMPDSMLGTHVIMAADKNHPLPMPHVSNNILLLPWIQLGLIGHFAEEEVNADLAALSRVSIPKEFIAILYNEVTPGTTLILTDAPITTSTTGVDLTLFSAKSPEEARK